MGLLHTEFTNSNSKIFPGKENTIPRFEIFPTKMLKKKGESTSYRTRYYSYKNINLRRKLQFLVTEYFQQKRNWTYFVQNSLFLDPKHFREIEKYSSPFTSILTKIYNLSIKLQFLVTK